MSISRLNPRDLEFQLYEVLDVETLTARARYADHSRETFDAVLATARALAESHFQPHHRESDEHEPFVHDGRVVTPDAAHAALRAMAEAGFIAATHDEASGGMQLPRVVASAALLWFDAANVATASYALLTTGVANLVATFGTPDQRARYLDLLLTGRYFGTMALTEPDAGSSLADLRTRAVPAGDGHPPRHLPHQRDEDVDLRRRARDVGEHRAHGARPHRGGAPGCARHLAHAGATLSARRRRRARPQRRAARRPHSQDGMARHHEHDPQLR
jgi:hypothetical protein